jgi:hypothetical protein
MRALLSLRVICASLLKWKATIIQASLSHIKAPRRAWAAFCATFSVWELDLLPTLIV